MNTDKMTFEKFCDPEFRREQQMKVKSEAVWATFMELEGLINVSRLAKLYFGKSQSWLAQRINGYDVNNKRAEFTAEEYHQLSQALRNIASRLVSYADAIEAAEY